ncbi:hypothetical protein Tcan_10588 [Toxocara canis]|uniref:Uncharacterized protein n=1 Tax=Toxocara canis TaxID=6265 RepID=A0A0B2UV44_TOXCA|nr:hypothetical protein Tcan_10588 [Toxocara canis]
MCWMVCLIYILSLLSCLGSFFPLTSDALSSFEGDTRNNSVELSGELDRLAECRIVMQNDESVFELRNNSMKTCLLRYLLTSMPNIKCAIEKDNSSDTLIVDIDAQINNWSTCYKSEQNVTNAQITCHYEDVKAIISRHVVLATTLVTSDAK